MCWNKWVTTPLFLARASGDNVLYLMLFLHSLSTVCFIMFLSVLSHPLPLLFTRFLSQHSLFRQEGPLYFHRCLGVPDPACLCTVCVCVCPSLKTAVTFSHHMLHSWDWPLLSPSTFPLHLCLSFINNSQTVFSFCRCCVISRLQECHHSPKPFLYINALPTHFIFPVQTE